MLTLDRIADGLREIAAGLEAREYDGRDAARLAGVAADAERLCATIKVLFARRAADTRGWVASSHAATPEQWLANISGCPESAAGDALRTAERLDDLPATAAKLREGALSLTQAALVTRGAMADPAAERKLLRTADRGEMRALRTETERVVAAATDETEANARAHRERQAFDAARKADTREPREAYRFDGLIALADREPVESSTKQARPVARVRVDLHALLDGKTTAGEVCEIPGVGPVPVAHARTVLSHGLLELVITDGVDVQTVVSRTRHVPEALKIAIEERGQRCKVVGCDRTAQLERHHVDEYAKHHLTTYEIIGNACPQHHDLITYDHYTVELNDGTWTLHPPDEQRDMNAA